MSDVWKNRAWRRFRRNRPAWWCVLGLIAAVGAMTLLLPFSWSWFNVQDVENAVRAEPTMSGASPFELYAPALRGNPLGSRLARAGPAMHRAAGWFGYDEVGRSLFYRTAFGWLVSLAIGAGAAGMSVTIGVLWGAASGMAGGRVDAVMMRTVDILYGLPYILFVMVLKVVLEPPLAHLLGGRTQIAGIVVLFLAIGAVSWLTMARVIRGQVLSLRQQPFVEAARAAGAGPVRILWRHLLPNLVGPIVVYATLIVPQAVLQESFLSFLGIGIQQPTPSLGRLAADGVQAVNTFVGFWWLIAFPCGILVATLLALNLVGDGLRDALDPTSEMSRPV